MLERNGRAAGAQRVREVHSPDLMNRYDREWFNGQRQRATAMAKEEKWDWAFYHYSNYNPGSSCGNAIDEFRTRRNWLVVDCLLELERWGEVRELCRTVLGDPFLSSECFVEPFVESYGGEGRADLIEGELDRLIDESPFLTRQDVDTALGHREVLVLPDDAMLLRLSELTFGSDNQHWRQVDELLERAGPDGIEYWTGVLGRRRGEWSSGEHGVAWRMAKTGDSQYGLALQSWLAEEVDEDRRHRLQMLQWWWDRALGQEGEMPSLNR